MAFKKYPRPIDVFVNGEYVYTTNIHPNCKEAKAALKRQGKVMVASLKTGENVLIQTSPKDTITAFFARTKKVNANRYI